ncbi:MAG TPA: hypothetical protein VME46_11040, partial [Acidimicrobiales bacterium]|nr:hypothetical protein [Acidimicrobiales bacterium]
MTPEVAGALALALGGDRSSEERTSSLLALGDYLGDDDAVVAVAAAARGEEDARVRAVLLQLVAKADADQLARLPEALEVVGRISALDPETGVRLLANRVLSRVASAYPGAWDIVAENLVYDLDPGVQAACLAALATCTRPGPQLAERLVAFAAEVPPSLRRPLVDLYRLLPRPALEAGAVALLDPLESEAVRRDVLGALAGLPSLSPATVAALAWYLQAEQLPELRQQAVELLSEGTRATPELLADVLAAVLATPE